MVSYQVNGKIYDLPEEEVQGFLNEFPDAVIVEEPIPSPEESAPVEENAALDNTVSEPVDTSLELPTTYKVDGKIYDLPKEEVAGFLNTFPDAVPYEDPVKKVEALENNIQETAELSGYESIKNALFNLGEDVENIGEFYSGDSAAMDIASATIANYMFGEQDVQEFIKENKDSEFLTSGLSSQEEILEKIAKPKKNQH